MYELVRGYPIELLQFNTVHVRGRGNRSVCICDDIFTFDTETTSAYYNDGDMLAFGFDYDNPDKARNANKHSLCYLWQFGIGEHTRYIGRELTDFVLLLNKLQKYCPYQKSCYVHNLAFDFNFLNNVIAFSEVFARQPRHPMRAHDARHNMTFKCSYVLMSLSLENWAKSLNLPVQKHVGALDYHKIRTPRTPLTDDEIAYSIADLDVIYYGINKLKQEYGGLHKIPMTHTGKARLQCEKEMQNETAYCQKVTKLMPRTLEEYVEQAHAFIGGTVLCNWLYKNRTIENITPWDIASSYPFQLVNPRARYPMTPFFNAPKGKESYYMHNDKYVYLIRFKAYNIESKKNCHFLSRSKALHLKDVTSDNGRIVRCAECEYILTSVDYELFEQLYTIERIEIVSFRFARAWALNKTFRRFVLKLYRDKTELKGVAGCEELYQNRKATINSMYGDFVTKIFTDAVAFDFVNKEWTTTLLNETSFAESLKKLQRKRCKNYKAFIHGVFVTAWARKRIWDAVLYDDMDDHIVYSDTDSLKMWNYTGDFFEKSNKEVLEILEELKADLNVTDDDVAPKDINGVRHPIGLWEHETDVNFFRSLGCKQYLCEYADGTKALTCAGVSKLAVNCFESVDDFRIDRKLTEKELASCTDGKGHTAEKLTPYYSTDYPAVVYPDGYISRYKCGVCLMPTTFNLSITPNDLNLLYTEVLGKLNKVYYKGVK